jgi:hypothetical protein
MPGTYTRASTYVNARPDDVFAEIPQSWTGTMEQVTPGPVGVGTQFILKGKRVQVFSVTAFEPPHRYGLSTKSEEEGPYATIEYVLTPQGAGTTVELRAGMPVKVSDVIFKMGLGAPIILPIWYAMLRRIQPAERLAELKSRVEQFS